jgi:tetratricopeptide (TPR) repeat protein
LKLRQLITGVLPIHIFKYGAALCIVILLIPAPARAETVPDLLQQARAAEATGRFAEAASIWQRALELIPKNANAHLNLARELKEQGYFKQALSILDQTQQFQPFDLNMQERLANAYNNVGAALAESNNYEAGIAALQKAQQLLPNNQRIQSNLDTAYHNQALLAAKQGQPRIPPGVQPEPPSNPKPLPELIQAGNRAQAEGNFKQAVEIWRQVIQLKQADATIYNNLGIALVGQEQFQEATETLKKAVKLNPNNDQILANFASSYNAWGLRLSQQLQIQEAVKKYRQAIAIAPNYALAYNNLGAALIRLGQHQSAIKNLLKAVQLDPKNADSYNNLVIALSYWTGSKADKSKLDRAISKFKQAIINNPNDSVAYSNLGSGFKEEGYFDIAAAFLAKAVVLAPQNQVAQSNLNQITTTLMPPEISQRASQFTVKIEGQDLGTGVIVAKQESTYSVLTCWHTVRQPGDYFITTSDNKKYRVAKITHLEPHDLAMIDFNSEETYAMAEIGDSDQLLIGEVVHFAGYPAEQITDRGRAYRFFSSYGLSGFLSPENIPDEFKDSGYRLIITGPAFPGVSGGPILNRRGDLIGIYGRAETDGTTGEASLYGIPIDIYVKHTAIAQTKGSD